MDHVKKKSLSQLLLATWTKFEKQVRIALDKSSPRQVHQLRISTQKLEALLGMASGLPFKRKSDHLILLLKKVRKSMGPLRDVQVEEKALKNLNVKGFKTKKKRFSKFLKKKSSAAKEKTRRCLDKIPLKNEKWRAAKLMRKIKKIESQKHRNEIQSDLGREIKKSVLALNGEMKKINPARVNEIHQFRIHAKKLRYKAECLKSLSGQSHLDLKNLKAVQSIAGNIQDDSILLKTLDRFLAKKTNRNNTKILRMRKHVASHQKRILNDNFSKLNRLKWEN